jgi:hypothetical protein
MKAIALTLLAALAMVGCDKAAAERASDKSERKADRDSEEEAKPKKTASETAAPATSVAAKPSPSAEEEDTPEVADESGAPPAPTAADDAFKDVTIPVGVTIPTEEDYEEKAEKEITAANFESELAKIEKELAP